MYNEFEINVFPIQPTSVQNNILKINIHRRIIIDFYIFFMHVIPNIAVVKYLNIIISHHRFIRVFCLFDCYTLGL